MNTKDLKVGGRYLLRQGYENPYEAVVLEKGETAIKLRYMNGFDVWLLLYDFKHIDLLEELPNVEQNPKRSVATEDDSNTEADTIKSLQSKVEQLEIENEKRLNAYVDIQMELNNKIHDLQAEVERYREALDRIAIEGNLGKTLPYIDSQISSIAKEALKP